MENILIYFCLPFYVPTLFLISLYLIYDSRLHSNSDLVIRINSELPVIRIRFFVINYFLSYFIAAAGAVPLFAITIRYTSFDLMFYVSCTTSFALWLMFRSVKSIRRRVNLFDIRNAAIMTVLVYMTYYSVVSVPLNFLIRKYGL